LLAVDSVSQKRNTFLSESHARPAKAVFVLHAFQKKSKHGATTPRKEITLIRSRLAVAERAYKELYERK
jgi:phage-related protein